MGRERRLVATAPRAEHLLPGQGPRPVVANLLGEHAQQVLSDRLSEPRPRLHRPPRACSFLQSRAVGLPSLGRAARHTPYRGAGESLSANTLPALAIIGPNDDGGTVKPG